MKQSEHQIQASLFKWAELFSKAYPELKHMFAIPNGGYRHVTTAKRLKAEGVKAGVPDIFLPVPKNGKSGLFIEMKSEKGRLSDNQFVWVNNLANLGYEVAICNSTGSAVEKILSYLTTTSTKKDVSALQSTQETIINRLPLNTSTDRSPMIFKTHTTTTKTTTRKKKA